MPSLHAVGRLARAAWTGLLDVIYPPHCLHCGARTPTATAPLCSRCLQRLERASAPAVLAHVERLPAPTDALDAAAALWHFDKDGALQQVQHAIKYGNRPQYGVALGELMAACLDEEETVPDAVVPIPLHRVRRYERGYNQGAMLARGLATACDLPVRNGWLKRPVATRAQAHLSRADRWTNVASAFHAPAPEDVDGARILLVDDVVTTGSTAVAAATTLKAAGAAHVALCALAFARG